MTKDPASSNHPYGVTFYPKPYVVTSRMARLMFVSATLAFLFAQSMTVLIFFKRGELHFNHQILLYVVTFCAPFPWLAGIQGYRHIKRQFVPTGADQTLSQTVLYFLMFVIGVAYLELLFCLGLIIVGLNLRNR